MNKDTKHTHKLHIDDIIFYGEMTLIVAISVFTFVIIAVSVYRVLTSDTSESSTANSSITVAETFEQCEGYDDLYYDPATGVVYIRSNLGEGGAYCPYYSKYNNVYMWDGSNLVQIPEE